MGKVKMRLLMSNAQLGAIGQIIDCDPQLARDLESAVPPRAERVKPAASTQKIGRPTDEE